ncbi:protein NRT1/ PTR FAMILY 5.10-like [Dioscorea cayenensis subsp. rotundata]|uniref:Protein NRT1/ PTR FAMILY 5.10-like n=1 Tax=Dioscorea cayennensis subsp. rotundata TaxID=55577 RepID=A0AB40C368_DIOCR|nr:protein NRT1/ PTR FAMILY 5.10-like [Dioscorea cayenensis subsp. rotundata]
MESEALIQSSAVIAGVVDYRGRPITAGSRKGRWTSAFFIIGVEMAERFAYYGIGFNLITYLTGPLRQPTASAAVAVNMWSGMSMMLPLLGAFIADSYLGRYRTIIIASILYILGLGMLTFSSSLLPSILPQKCDTAMEPSSCPPSQLQVIIFFVSLYLVAFAQGGHKPCTQAFGADQFDQNDPLESKSRSSFFNWWYFGMNFGMLFTTVLNYVQDSVSWGFGFGIPCMAMVLALIVFLSGSRTYRYWILEVTSPFIRIGKACWQASTVKASQTEEEEEEAKEAKGVIRLFSIWTACLIYAIVFAQSMTFFTKQASTLDRRIGSSFVIPSASLQSIGTVSIVAFIPIYDHILVPAIQKLTGLQSGITMLQRIGIGMAISATEMVVAALVEMKRIKTAREYGLIDSPDIPIPMNLLWLMPQYVLYGLSDVFTMVGLQEFFYDQMPDSLRSLGLALYLSIFGVGSFLSGFIVSLIDKVSAAQGESWFPNNLNHAHLDYFFWLLAVLNALGLLIYIYFAQAYAYRKKGCCTML